MFFFFFFFKTKENFLPFSYSSFLFIYLKEKCAQKIWIAVCRSGIQVWVYYFYIFCLFVCCFVFIWGFYLTRNEENKNPHTHRRKLSYNFFVFARVLLKKINFDNFSFYTFYLISCYRIYWLIKQGIVNSNLWFKGLKRKKTMKLWKEYLFYTNINWFYFNKTSNLNIFFFHNFSIFTWKQKLNFVSVYFATFSFDFFI